MIILPVGVYVVGCAGECLVNMLVDTAFFTVCVFTKCGRLLLEHKKAADDSGFFVKDVFTIFFHEYARAGQDS